jgi:hypothetical protein
MKKKKVKTQAYNYSRDALKFLGELSDTLFAAAEVDPRAGETLKQLPYVIELLKMSPKFMLPEGGRYTEDKELRGLDPDEPLHLPFDSVVLEYHTDCPEMRGDQHLSTKRIVIAFAAPEMGGVLVVPIVYMDSMKGWYPYPTVRLPSTGYLQYVEGDSSPRIMCDIPDVAGRTARDLDVDYGEELGVLLSFLNMLQCANVRTEKTQARPLSRAQRRKNALPFDSYHIITIGDHRQNVGGSAGCSVGRHKRTHVRRGHIRRLQSGKKVWVNACVVNPNIAGSGKITKDYKFKQ